MIKKESLLETMGVKDKNSYRVQWSEEDKEYVGTCVGFSSLSWLSPTQEGALVGIRRLVREYQIYKEGIDEA